MFDSDCPPSHAPNQYLEADIVIVEKAQNKMGTLRGTNGLSGHKKKMAKKVSNPYEGDLVTDPIVASPLYLVIDL